MSPEPYKHRAIPRSGRGWASEVEGIHRFLRELRTTSTKALPGWKTKMERYYKHRLRVLMEHPPKNVIGVRRGRVIFSERNKPDRNGRSKRK